MQIENNPKLGQECVVTHNVVSIHSDPNSKSEQISQSILGQTVVIEAGQKDWFFVKMWDEYRGWISSSYIRPYSSNESIYSTQGIVAVVKDLIADIYTGPRLKAPIITKAVMSTELKVINSDDDWVEILLPNNYRAFIQKKRIKLIDKSIGHTIWLPDYEKIIETAYRFVGVPYLWGGCTPFGIDCSGFVQLVYKILGVTLPRDAHLQAQDSRCVDIDINELRTGDLIFFCSNSDFEKKKITHVALAINNDSFIHSSSTKGVCMDFLDKYKSATLVSTKRISFGTLDIGI
ncbi:MAG: NlpC/P60 family protein [Armatimonadota bacterium]